MRVLLQVVKEASVEIEKNIYSQIQKGFLLFVGFNDKDNIEIINKTLEKTLSLRVFTDEVGKMNLSLDDIKGEVLIVSQFTLYADVKKGRRPSFINASRPEISNPLYEYAVRFIRQKGYYCKTGIFGADMKVHLINDGPTTIWIDSEEL